MKIAQRVAMLTVGLTLVLIAVGVIVRATGSGLGCPDWPLCHGGAVPPGHKHALIEFSHRFTAMIVGFLVIAVAVLAWRFYRHSAPTVWVAILTVPLVGIQGLLGAITVVRELPPEIVATHLITAMVVLSCEVFVAISMYVLDPDRAPATVERLTPALRQTGKWALLSIAWLAALMWIGAYMAESGASTACEGWPLCSGSVLPASDDQEVTHMIHRYLAAGFLFVLAPWVLRCWRARNDASVSGMLAIAVSVLFVAQVTVGALNVWFTFPDILTVSHTVIASLIWASLSASAVIGLYQPATDPRRFAVGAGLPA